MADRHEPQRSRSAVHHDHNPARLPKDKDHDDFEKPLTSTSTSPQSAKHRSPVAPSSSSPRYAPIVPALACLPQHLIIRFPKPRHTLLALQQALLPCTSRILSSRASLCPCLPATDCEHSLFVVLGPSVDIHLQTASVQPTSRSSRVCKQKSGLPRPITATHTALRLSAVILARWCSTRQQTSLLGQQYCAPSDARGIEKWPVPCWRLTTLRTRSQDTNHIVPGFVAVLGRAFLAKQGCWHQVPKVDQYYWHHLETSANKQQDFWRTTTHNYTPF